MEFTIKELRKNLSIQFEGVIGVDNKYIICWKNGYIGRGYFKSNQTIKNETQLALVLGLEKERIINKFNDLWSFIGFIGQLKSRINEIEGANNGN